MGKLQKPPHPNEVVLMLFLILCNAFFVKYSKQYIR